MAAALAAAAAAIAAPGSAAAWLSSTDSPMPCMASRLSLAMLQGSEFALSRHNYALTFLLQVDNVVGVDNLNLFLMIMILHDLHINALLQNLELHCCVILARGKYQWTEDLLYNWTLFTEQLSDCFFLTPVLLTVSKEIAQLLQLEISVAREASLSKIWLLYGLQIYSLQIGLELGS